jgi:hypothetical protein
MFTQLPGLFGKNFLVGYFLPACLTAAAIVGLSDLHGYSAIYGAIRDYVASGSEHVPIGEFTLGVLVTWTWAIFLLGVNFPLTRTLEGYGRFNPARLWRSYSLRRFRALKKAMAKNQQTRNEAYAEAAMEFAAGFPESEDLVLPTRFGNVLRAAERYPQVLYSMDAIQLWPRLESVAPAAHCNAIADVRAVLDLWINLWFGALVVTGAEVAFALTTHCPRLLIAALSPIAAITAAKLAQSAAAEFGSLVKATFDLYRGELSAQLGLNLPNSPEKEREMWTAVSQSMLYREPGASDDLAEFRHPTSRKAKGASGANPAEPDDE